MSVSIVTTQPKPTQATVTDNTTSGENAATQGFASLLQGQLHSTRPVALETVQKTTEQELSLTESAPSDASVFLAALGLISQESSRKADAAQVEDSSLQDDTKIDGIVSDTSNPTPIAIQTAAVIAQNLEPVSNTKNSTSASLQTTAIVGQSPQDFVSTDAVPSGTTAIEDRPAKFAAVTAIEPTTENPSTKTVSADAIQSSIPPLVGNPNTHPIRHEVSLSVPTPVRDQAWATDFGQKIVWLASNDKQSAQITLNPPQMGPIEISLSLDKGNASASFTSANSEVRNALETAMPKLREMFASAGIELGQTNVSAESFRQQAENGNANRGSSQWRSDNAILVADSAISPSARAFTAQHGNGLVDIFA